MPIITDPAFYAVAIPAVLLVGVSKSGFGAGFGAGFGQAEMPHLAGLDQLLHRLGRVLNRHIRIDAVLVEEVDHVGP